MKNRYDVLIIGAGPAGAMAAKTAGEIGLKTAVIERKTNPAEITRSCATMFAIESDYYFGERMYYCDKTRKMVFPVNGLTVDYDGPARNFYGWHFYAPDGVSRIAFGDYEKNIKMGNSGRLSFIYDKGLLLESLIHDAKKNGADIYTGLNFNAISKTTDGLKVRASDMEFEAAFVIGADGISSRTAGLMGFNRDRVFFNRTGKKSCTVKGLDIPDPESINFVNCPNGNTTFPVWISPGPVPGEHMIEFKDDSEFEIFTKKSPFAKWCKNMEITRTMGYVLSLYSPVSWPCKDNVLLAGDATWFGEAEITGSMLCGWKAAHAVALAFKNGLLNDEGVASYGQWWEKSFPGFADYRNFFMILLFVKSILSPEEINYLYQSIKAPLTATLNPFRVVDLVKEAFAPAMEQAAKEMPSLAQKLQMMDIKNFDMILRMVQKKG